MSSQDSWDDDDGGFGDLTSATWEEGAEKYCKILRASYEGIVNGPGKPPYSAGHARDVAKLASRAALELGELTWMDILSHAFAVCAASIDDPKKAPSTLLLLAAVAQVAAEECYSIKVELGPEKPQGEMN